MTKSIDRPSAPSAPARGSALLTRFRDLPPKVSDIPASVRPTVAQCRRVIAEAETIANAPFRFVLERAERFLSCYPQRGAGLDLKAYAEEIVRVAGDYPAEVIEAALQKLLHASRFIPAIAEIVEALKAEEWKALGVPHGRAWSLLRLYRDEGQDIGGPLPSVRLRDTRHKPAPPASAGSTRPELGDYRGDEAR